MDGVLLARLPCKGKTLGTDLKDLALQCRLALLYSMPKNNIFRVKVAKNCSF